MCVPHFPDTPLFVFMSPPSPGLPVTDQAFPTTFMASQPLALVPVSPLTPPQAHSPHRLPPTVSPRDTRRGITLVCVNSLGRHSHQRGAFG